MDAEAAVCVCTGTGQSPNNRLDYGAMSLWCLRAAAGQSPADGPCQLLQQIASQAKQQEPQSSAPGLTMRMHQLLGRVRQRAQQALLLRRGGPADIPDLILLLLPDEPHDSLQDPGSDEALPQLADFDALMKLCGSLSVPCAYATTAQHAWEQLNAEHGLGVSSKPQMVPPVLLTQPEAAANGHQMQADLVLKLHGVLSLINQGQGAKL